MFIINNLSKSYGDKELFKNVNMTIYKGEKIGIVGVNGSGKSTFIKMLTGQISPDEGVIKSVGTIAYVSQIAERTNINEYMTAEFVQFLKNNSDLSLSNELNRDFSTLSGGEKMKYMISYALSQNADTLLLDEPTNNLDQESIEWLIKKLQEYKGTIIVVSHDRYFLDQIVNKILDFDNGCITEYGGGYTDYEVQRRAKKDYEQRLYNEKVAENKKIQGQIEKLSSRVTQLVKSSKRDGSSDRHEKGYRESVQKKAKKVGRQVRAKRNRLEKLQQDLDVRPFEEKEIFYRLKGEELHNKLLVKFTNVSKSFDKDLFTNVNLAIEKGEKIGIVGVNGSGKSTFIKMLLGEESYNGDIWRSQNLKIAYLPQDAFDLQSSQTIMEFADNFSEFKTHFLTNMCNMGFDRESFCNKISSLSAGEKMKLKLNELIVGDFNLLIMDEPTNNLDIKNKIFLENVLKGYKGNLLIVSHDKTLIENVCNTKFVIMDKKISKVEVNNES